MLDRLCTANRCSYDGLQILKHCVKLPGIDQGAFDWGKVTVLQWLHKAFGGQTGKDSLGNTASHHGLERPKPRKQRIYSRQVSYIAPNVEE